MSTLTTRAEVIDRRTYRRPLPNGTQETRMQMLRRSHHDHQRRLWEDQLRRPITEGEERELNALLLAAVGNRLSVAGRTRWLGGTDIAYARPATQYNCLGGDTPVVTREYGVQPIRSLVDKEVDVLDGNGDWVTTTIRHYGKNVLQQVSLSYVKYRQSVLATPDHRWILADGREVYTSDLRPGDRIPLMSAPRPTRVTEAVRHGMVYGDGSRQTGQNNYYQMRAFNDHEDILPWFDGFPRSYPPCWRDKGAQGGVVISCKGIETDWKALPDNPSVEYAYSFFLGWLATDGSCTHGVTSLACDAAGVEWLKTHAPRFGVYVSGVYQLPDHTNYGKRTRDTFSVRFARWSIVPEDHLISRKRNNLRSPKVKTMTVKEISNPTGNQMYDVYCAVVPTTHSFTLGFGLLTGNCSNTYVRTGEDFRDLFWLELLGCGTGFIPKPGTLYGFHRLGNLKVREGSDNPDFRGRTTTEATVEGDTFTLSVGDSAEGWAESLRILLNPGSEARQCHELVLDFSQIRGPGGRLKGFGWLCNGWKPLRDAYVAIWKVMRGKGGSLLDGIDMLDIVNHLGTVLSTRRSAQIAQMLASSPDYGRFRDAKVNRHIDNPHRSQSNNSGMYFECPEDIEAIVESNLYGADFGIINLTEGLRRAPWFVGTNPCAEILLPSGGFCNLVEVNGAAFHPGQFADLERTVELAARANYRQTCVDLRDGVLQPHWHDANDALRLCGTSMTGICTMDWLTPYQRRRLRDAAVYAARDMARELGTPYSKAVTCIKPSGTLSKVLSTVEFGEVPEGIHRPIARHIFNWVQFSEHDPLVPRLEAAGYKVETVPNIDHAVVVAFPVAFERVKFTDVGDGLFVNDESAVSQLERTRVWNQEWCDHNASVTIYFDQGEVKDIAKWVRDHWYDGSFVSLSFLPRTNPHTRPEDFGVRYLPQQVVNESTYRTYAESLIAVVFPDEDGGEMEIEMEECAGGACPVR